MSSTALGILGGLLAAFMQSCSYLGGRRFLGTGGNAGQLLAASLIICGASSWLLAPFFLDWEKFFSLRMAWMLLLSNGGLLLGHWGFFSAQKHIESSRIASLMGLKILLVMLLMLIFMHANFTLLQYIAIVLAASAAILINWINGKLDWNGMGYFSMALLGYACSDLGVQLVVQEMQCSNPIAGGLAGFSASYGVLGFFALAALKPLKVNFRMLKKALPQGVCWVFSMWGLYVCFGLLGAAFGNVVQASRGIISLILGIILSFFAIQGLEQKQSWVMWLRKAVAALMMFGAIVLYAMTAKG